MDIDELLARAQDTISIRRVFGEPIKRRGTLVIPVAVVAGGGGGGGGGDRRSRSGRREEFGAGYGMWARPLGVYVVRRGEVRFHPAVDVLPLVMGAAVVIRGLLGIWSRRSRPG
jgi:uncharacterized spore protein YtfJ